MAICIACSWNSGTPRVRLRMFLELGLGIRVTLLGIGPVLQVGMHHAALYGTGPHDRHLDNEVVVLARLESLGSIDICARLSTWNTPTELALHSMLDGGVLLPPCRWCASRRSAFRSGQAFAQASQHAQPQHVDLVDPERVEIVLVPFDEYGRPWPRSGWGSARRADPR